MINTQDKLLFIHVPKTAGCSAVAALTGDHYFGGSLLGKCHATHIKNNDGVIGRWRFIGARTHSSFRMYKKWAHETGEDLDTYFKFTMIRNPWEQVVSYWKYRNMVNGTSYRFSKFLTSRHACGKRLNLLHLIEDIENMDYIIRFGEPSHPTQVPPVPLPQPSFAIQR